MWLNIKLMITSIILLTFLASFVLYNTSKKAMLQQSSSVEKWLQTNEKTAKIIGILTLIIAATTATFHFGITAGILFWLITLMTILSLLVILYPFKKINYKHLIGIFTIILIIELTLV